MCDNVFLRRQIAAAMTVPELREACGMSKRNAKGEGSTDKKALISQYVETKINDPASSQTAELQDIFADVAASSIVGKGALAAIDSQVVSIGNTDFIAREIYQAAFTSVLFSFLTWCLTHLHLTGDLRDLGKFYSKRTDKSSKKVYVNMGDVQKSQEAVTLHFVGAVRGAIRDSGASDHSAGASLPKVLL